jgi:hypothetical protein
MVPQVTEGLVMLLLAVVMWFFLTPDLQEQLFDEQTALVLKRIEDDRGDAIPDPINIFQTGPFIWSCDGRLYGKLRLMVTHTSRRCHVYLLHNACL